MISCQHCEELINARLDGYLTEEEVHLLEHHLAQCADCRKLDQDLTSLHDRLNTLSCDPPEDLAASVMAQLEGTTLQSGKKKTSSWATAVCAAAVVLLVVAISPRLLPFGSSSDEAATAGDAAHPTESMVMDAEPTEGDEAAGATLEESQTETKIDRPLSQDEAMERLEDYLANTGIFLAAVPATPAREGEFWVFQVENANTGEVFWFSVSCTNGSVAETPPS